MKYTKTQMVSANIQFFLNPFLIFASIEFAPWWISTPATIILVMLWAGSTLMIGKRDAP